MAITEAQYNALIRRIEAFEAAVNLIMSAVSKLSTLDQLRQLTVIRQAEIEDLKTRMTAQENLTELLSNYHRT